MSPTFTSAGTESSISTRSVWLASRDGKAEPRQLLPDSAEPDFPADGRWLAYCGASPNQIYVQPYPGLDHRTQVSINGGTVPVWRRDGRELYYLQDVSAGGAQRVRVMAVPLTTTPTFSAGTPHALFEGAFRNDGGSFRNYDVTADGQPFLMVQEVQRPPVRGSQMVLVQIAFTLPYALPAISPDGTRVVYGAKDQDGKQQLWLRRLDSPTAQPLPGTEDAATPFWAPDSRWVGFGQGNKLKKIDVQGGPPVAVTELPSAVRGGSWNDQGVIIVGVVGTTGASGVLRVAASGGTAVEIKGSEGRHPWFLPDGRHFLYQAAEQIRVGDLDETGAPGRSVAPADSPAVYAAGNLLYLRENTLMAQPFDATRLETTGEAVPVAEGIPTFTTGSRIPGFAVSPAGLLLYQSGGAGTQSRLVWKDRQGQVLGTLPQARIVSSMNLSPDGTRAAVAQWDRGTPAEDVWLYDLDRGIPTRLTTDPKNDVLPVWSPDGATVYFSSDRNGTFKIFRRPSNGTGTDELVLDDAANVFPRSISPDGKLLLCSGGSKMRALPLTGVPERAKSFVLPEVRSLRSVDFSPDGRWVVYSVDNDVYAAPFPGPGATLKISRDGGQIPRWRKDGKEILFASPDRTLTAVDVVERNGTLQIGEARALFRGIVTSSRGFGAGITYDVSRDGQKFLVFDDGASTTAQPLTLVQNWTALLRK